MGITPTFVTMKLHILSRSNTNSLLSTIFLAFILWMSTPAFAQLQDNRDNFRIGFKGGINNSNVYDESGDQFVANNKGGFVFGGYMSIPFDVIVGFQPEILVSQKGFDASGMYFGGSYNFRRTTTYLDIPLQLQIKAGPLFSFLVGPQYSYLLSTRDEYGNGTVTETQEEEISNDNFRKNIFGAVVGGDIHLNSLCLSARAGWDLTRNHGNGTSSTPRYKNHWIQFTIGVEF